MSYPGDVISPQYNNYALSDDTKDHTKKIKQDSNQTKDINDEVKGHQKSLIKE